MRIAMLLLALGCLAIGALPALVTPVLDPVIRGWSRFTPPPPALAELLPWAPLSAMNSALVVAVLGAGLLLRARARRRAPATTVTWDCGYARPGPTMAYTASSFAEILVGLHAWLLRPRAESAVCREPFAPARGFHVRVPEQVLDGVLAPLWAGFRRRLLPLRSLQQGRIQQYLVYVLLTLCALLAALVPFQPLVTRLLGW
jgi:hypothetical protein